MRLAQVLYSALSPQQSSYRVPAYVRRLKWWFSNRHILGMYFRASKRQPASPETFSSQARKSSAETRPPPSPETSNFVSEYEGGPNYGRTSRFSKDLTSDCFRNARSSQGSVSPSPDCSGHLPRVLWLILKARATCIGLGGLSICNWDCLHLRMSKKRTFVPRFTERV